LAISVVFNTIKQKLKKTNRGKMLYMAANISAKNAMQNIAHWHATIF